MKNNKILIVIGIVLLNILAIYMTGQAFLGKESEYDIKLREARSYAEADLCQKSVNAYNDALWLKDTLAINIEKFSVFEKGIKNGEFTNVTKLYSEVMDITEKYPKKAQAYEVACDFMLKYEKFDKCAELLMKADDLHITSEKLTDILKTVRYKNKLTHTMYTDISTFYDGSYLAVTDDIYCFLNQELSHSVGGNYNFASSFSAGYAFVREGTTDSEFRSFVIDKNGVRQCYLPGVTESSGIGKGYDKKNAEVLLIAGKNGNTYKYYDLTGKEVFGEYFFAGRFRNNVAAVQEKEGQWKLINATGSQIVDTVFEDIILNEFDECAPKGLIFAKSGGKYHLYDVNGKQIGDFSCDNARPFIEDLTAFASGDKWGFVDAKGNVVIEPKYEDAKAFSKGVAGVKSNGSWVFINKAEEVVIEGFFDEAGYMCENGKCFVKMNNRWSVMNMYYIAD